MTISGTLFDNEGDLLARLAALERRLEQMEGRTAFVYLIKTTTGDPSVGVSGMFCENTADNTLRVYTEGAWRTIISW